MKKRSFFEEFFDSIMVGLNEGFDETKKGVKKPEKEVKVNGRETRAYPENGKYVFELYENGVLKEKEIFDDVFELIEKRSKDTRILPDVKKCENSCENSEEDCGNYEMFYVDWDEENLSWDIPDYEIYTDDLFEIVHKLAVEYKIDWEDLEEFKNRLIVYLDSVKEMSRAETNFINLLN